MRALVSTLACAAALSLGTAVAAPSTASAAGFCPTTWNDFFDHSVGLRGGDWLYGENQAMDVGFKGYVDPAVDELELDGYSGAHGYEGTAVVDRSGVISMSGNFTAIVPMSYGHNCSDPSTLRFFLKAQANGGSSYVWRW